MVEGKGSLAYVLTTARLPRGAPWLNDWASQFDPFPRGRNDDLVDALSQGLGWLVSQRSVGTRDGMIWGRAR